jgi:serine/threonine protein kinase
MLRTIKTICKKKNQKNQKKTKKPKKKKKKKNPLLVSPAQRLKTPSHTPSLPFIYLFSFSAKDFVKKLLVVNPAQRLTAGQALTHEWIQRAAPKRELKSFGSVRDGIRNLKQAPPARKAD